MSSQITITDSEPAEVVRSLQSQLTRSDPDRRPIALLTCGIAGSGKTTFSKEVLRSHPCFHRLSTDEIIASRHGIYNIDYEPHKYDEYSEEADGVFLEELRRLLVDESADVILDRSLYDKEDRDMFKAIIEESGARWVLVHFKVSPEVLWRRIRDRRQNGIDANCALEISEDLFKSYVDGFDHPNGEGEIVIEYNK